MWTFVSPRIVFGEDALDALDQVRGQRALIVSDRGVVELGLVEPVMERLRRSGFEIRVFDDVEPDPSIPTVVRGAEVARLRPRLDRRRGRRIAARRRQGDLGSVRATGP